MTSPSMAAPRQNMMPTYEISCRLPANTHMKAQAINFFGCLYDASGVHPDLGKVDAVHALPAPTNVTEPQEFLGLVTYLSPFIPGLSTLTTPLQELLQKDTDFIWNCTYDAAFELVKEAVISDTTLGYFDPSLLVTIQVNASQVGLGAALLQNGKPIAFASKALTKTECQYANIERVMLSLEWRDSTLTSIDSPSQSNQTTSCLNPSPEKPSRHSCMATMHDVMPTGIQLHNLLLPR